MGEKDSKLKNISKNLETVTKKIKFMEVMVKSSISRKIINHCIIGIIKKYKELIKITFKDKDNFTISFEKRVQNVSKEDANILINFLYDKKDKLNDHVHFFNIEKPDFIDDLWKEFFEFIGLKDNNLINFNKIVTEDIKNNFKFSQKDQGISSFVKNFPV